MIKKLRVAVDHGNRNMKTYHFIFTSGLNVLDKKPARGEQYLQYEGKYYTLSEQRIPYQRDKTLDFRFFILTLFAIAMELEWEGADSSGGCRADPTSYRASAEAFCRTL